MGRCDRSESLGDRRLDRGVGKRTERPAGGARSPRTETGSRYGVIVHPQDGTGGPGLVRATRPARRVTGTLGAVSTAVRPTDDGIDHRIDSAVDAGVDGVAADGGKADRGRRSWRHPVAAVAALGTVSAIAQVLWVDSHRHLGGFSVDEAGYLATAFRLHRAWDGVHPYRLVEEFLATPRLGPFVPLLSVPFMSIFGRNTTAAFMALALMYVVTAVAVAAIVDRLSTRTASLIAGIICLGLPPTLITARNYQLASGATAFLCLAVLALISSARGARTLPMVWFGAAVGAMLLSRTMPIALLPGLAIAAAVQVRWTRRSVINLLGSVVAMVAVAGPWWIHQWHGITQYLFSFGYGHGTTEIVNVPLPLRLPIRMGIFMTDVRPLLVVPVLIVVVVAARRLWLSRRSLPTLRPLGEVARSVLAICLVLGFGMLALLSSSNNGTFFQSPLEVLAIAPICVIAARLGGTPVRVAGALAVVGSIANIVLMSVWTPFADLRVGGTSYSIVAFGGTEVQQAQDFEPIDPRFAPSASWADRTAAERDWRRSTATVFRSLASLGGDRPPLVTVVGELDLLNANTLKLESELTRTPLRIESTAAPESLVGRTIRLDPTDHGTERVLLWAAPPGNGPDRAFDAAGTTAVIYRHTAAAGGQ